MPNSNSAKKRLRQNVALRDTNRAKRSTIRTQVKRVREAIAEGNVETSESAFQAATKGLDQAAAKRLIHPNAAARTKSRLAAAIKSLKGKV